MKTISTMFEIENSEEVPLVYWISMSNDINKCYPARLMDSEGIQIEGIGAKGFKIKQIITKPKENRVIAIVDIFPSRLSGKYIVDALKEDKVVMRYSKYEERWKFTPTTSGTLYLDYASAMLNEGNNIKPCIDMIITR